MKVEALYTLFNTLDFHKYDSNYEDYLEEVNKLLKQYDYQSFINGTLKFIKEGFSTERKVEKYVWYLKGLRLLPKKTKEEYFKDDQKEYEEHLRFKERFIKQFGSWKNKQIEPRQPFVIYLTYTYTYLRQISLKKNMPIIYLCEIKGLNPNWLKLGELNN